MVLLASRPRLTFPHSVMSLSPTEIWTRLLDRARQELPEQTFRSWLEPTEALEVVGSTIFIGSPDQFAAELERLHIR